MRSTNILEQPIEYLKGVGPKKAALLKKELSIFTCGDLLFSFPFRYEDRTKFHKINSFNGKISIPHPEIEPITEAGVKEASTFTPVYSSTEILNKRGVDVKARRRLIKTLFEKIQSADISENLPPYLIEKLNLPARNEAIVHIHFPKIKKDLERAQKRLKFEELFFLQLRLLKLRRNRKDSIKGIPFSKIGDHFLGFYNNKLPFELTGAQKRVLKEIRQDLGSGAQLNRLLQGDVGSGKTIVGLMCMLMALDNDCQACLMAPTEILAQQHYQGISEYVEGMDIKVGFLSGSIKSLSRMNNIVLV